MGIAPVSSSGRDAGRRSSERRRDGDQLDDGLDLGGEVAVGPGAGDACCADGVAHGRRSPGGGLQRRAQVERRGRAVSISMASTRVEAVDRPAQLAGGAPAHRDVVLLHRATTGSSRRWPGPRAA